MKKQMGRFAALALLIGVVSAGCTNKGKAGEDMNAIATDYVKTQLEIGERDPGYIDSYYGPPEWQAAAKKSPRTLEQLAGEVDNLIARLKAVKVADLEPMEQRRHAVLLGQLVAAKTRLRMVRGERLSFGDEAEGLFDVRPELKELSSYDPVLARLEKLVPGDGPLADRVSAFQNRFNIPKDKLGPAIDAAIAECKRRTLEHISLPANEKFSVEYVTNKSWSGYNYYQGNANSKIQINTDLPSGINKIVSLGCHEGYPGHHVLGTLLEQELSKKRGWVEYSILPLYSPLSLIAEGSANYGIEIAFPGQDRLNFEKAVLYPLAGLSTREADQYHALEQAKQDLGGASFTIARDYLEGRITRDQAIALLQKYSVTSKEKAAKSVDFFDQYRSYTINYGLGLDMVRAYVEAAGSTPKERWAAFRRVISEPTLPSDIVVR